MPILEPVDADYADHAPHVVHAETTVRAPAAAVWQVLVDNSTWTEWFPAMRSCETTSKQLRGVGSTRRVKVVNLVADERIVLWEPEVAWGFTVTRTNIPMARRMLERVDLTDAAGGDGPATDVVYTGAFAPHLLTRLTMRLVARQAARTWQRGLDGLARHVEASR